MLLPNHGVEGNERGCRKVMEVAQETQMVEVTYLLGLALMTRTRFMAAISSKVFGYFFKIKRSLNFSSKIPYSNFTWSDP